MNSYWQVNIQGHLRCFIDLNAMGHSKGAADGNEIRWLRLSFCVTDYCCTILENIDLVSFGTLL